MNELTDKQIVQQDFVLDTLGQLVEDLFAVEYPEVMDIELLGSLRDVIVDWAIDNVPGFNEYEFYPWIEDEKQ